MRSVTENNLFAFYSDPSQVATYLEAEWSDFLIPDSPCLSGGDEVEHPDKLFGPVPPIFYQSIADFTFHQATTSEIKVNSYCDVGGATGRACYEIAMRFKGLTQMVIFEPSSQLAQWAGRLLKGIPPFDHFPTVQSRHAPGIARPHRLPPPISGEIDLEIICDPISKASHHFNDFDLITCLNVVDRHPDPRGLVRDLGSLLRPGGMLVLSSPLDFDVRFTPDKNEWVEDLNSIFINNEWLHGGEINLLYSIRKTKKTKIHYQTQVVAKIKP